MGAKNRTGHTHREEEKKRKGGVKRERANKSAAHPFWVAYAEQTYVMHA